MSITSNAAGKYGRKPQQLLLNKQVDEKQKKNISNRVFQMRKIGQMKPVKQPVVNSCGQK